MRINPEEYKTEIHNMFFYHGINSILNFIAMIPLSWFSFSPQAELMQHSHSQKFNLIAYPIYIALLIIPFSVLYLMVKPFLNMFTHDQNITVNFDAMKRYNETIQKKIVELTGLFQVSSTPEIQIIKNDAANAFVFQWTACSQQYLSVNTACLRDNEKNAFSLDILLAHELIHFKYDLPFFSVKRFSHLFYVFNLIFLCLFYTPLQIGFSIAHSATIAFTPASIYLPLIGLFLANINVLCFLHELRTRERRADYCALFSEKKFPREEFQKHLISYAFTTPTDLCHQFFSTHPPAVERIALLQAAEENTVKLITM